MLRILFIRAFLGITYVNEISTVHSIEHIKFTWQNFRIYMKLLLWNIEVYMPAVMVLLTEGNSKKKCGMVSTSSMTNA
jgi:hypothetical protein